MENTPKDLGERFVTVDNKITQQNILDSYHNYLQAELNHSNLLDFPYIYFYTSKTSLYCLGLNVIVNPHVKIPDETIDLLAQYYNIAKYAIPKIMLALFQVLSGTEYSPYFRRLAQFKWQCYLLYLPPFDMHFPSVSNGRIYVDLSVDGRLYREILTEKLMNKIVSSNNGKYLASDKIKKNLSSAILKSYKSKHNSSNPDRELRIEFINSTLSYWSSMKKAKLQKKTPIDYNSNPYAPLTLNSHTPPKASDILRNMLYKLTNGSIANLDTLAELIARLLIYNQPSKYVWVITGKLSSRFIALLNCLCDGRISPSVFNVHPDKLNNALITDDSKSIYMQTPNKITPIKVLMKNGISMLKRLISGNNTVKPDIYNPDLGLNYSPLVVYPVLFGTKDYKPQFKTLPYRVFVVDEMPDDNLLTAEDFSWLKTVLAARGMQILSGETTSDYEEDLLKMGLDSFISSFCSYGCGLSVPCKTFRDAFIKYAKANNVDLDIFNHPTQLITKISELAFLRKETVRKHRNCMCFLDIEISGEKLSKITEEHNSFENEKNISQINFNACLDSLYDLVLFE